ncbi:MAG TPA: sterol desaturase family protein [Tepidisphaeraceae bacterium]|jgi:sterol desaturase/sphingolipid hydroxylase (fatty acid hydroxylase superfamily)|nr:sterol desaturase family protein [Tepidisphaeraceae bacterium]
MPTYRPTRDKDLPLWITGAAVLGGFVALAWLERRYPLRRKTHEPTATHDARNIAIAGMAGAVMQLAERPITNRLTLLVRERSIGLLPALRLPSAVDTVLGCLLLDVTLYHWHYLAHKVPLLWRFHRVHHADLDMNASTGLRFHFGEILISVLFRAAQVLVFGISRRALSIWGTLLLIEVMFHHSNIGLPRATERWLSKLIVTPRLHGIHHSLEPDEVNSNWSSGLTIWDWLHGTFRRHPKLDDALLDIGVPELREPRQVTLGKLITLPVADNRALPPQAVERDDAR